MRAGPLSVLLTAAFPSSWNSVLYWSNKGHLSFWNDFNLFTYIVKIYNIYLKIKTSAKFQVYFYMSVNITYLSTCIYQELFLFSNKYLWSAYSLPVTIPIAENRAVKK